MATTLEEVHAEAFEERERASFMNDPAIATPGTLDDAKEFLLDQVVPYGGPAVVKPEAGTDLEHNPYATVVTQDENGNEVEPQGVEDEDEAGDEAAPAIDVFNGEVNTTNDLNLDVGADADEAPAQNASKAEWVDYAVAQGADRDEAEASTKAELQATYG